MVHAVEKVTLSLVDLGLKPGETRALKIGANDLLIVCGDSSLPETILRDKCAHMGSQLVNTRNGFTCESHGWTYSKNGENSVEGNPGLESVPFEIRANELVVELCEKQPVLNESGHLDGSECLQLLSHASFLLSAGESRILFDPWLEGPAYWGSWHHFPKNFVAVGELDVTHVVITHPHPDHFHLPTLEQLDREITVIIPNFESGILQKELRKLNFRNIHLLEWEEELWLADGLGLMFLRPVSQWEDSSCLVRVKDWIWLNQNDSGSALRDDLIPHHVDLLTTAFDLPTSAWPLTWNLSDGRKEAILRASKRSILDTIRSRCEKLQVKYYAPFAGWWRLALDIHQSFAQRIDHVTHSDLSKALSETSTKLIPALPSSKIVLKDMSHSWDEKVERQLEQQPTVEVFDLPPRKLNNDHLEKLVNDYMKNLEMLSKASGCEPVRFNLRVPDAEYSRAFRFGDKNALEMTTISAEIPGWAAELLVSGDSTAIWNHIDLGYWCRWSRTPDAYPANFMRMLQLGLPVGLIPGESPSAAGGIASKSVAELIEKDPELASAILTRSGLPCSSCAKSNSDTLENAFKVHRISGDLRLRAERQLTALFDG